MKRLLVIAISTLFFIQLYAQLPNGEYKISGYTTMNQDGVIDDGEFPIDALNVTVSNGRYISVKCNRYAFYTWRIDKIIDITKDGGGGYILYDTRNDQRQIAQISYQKEDSDRFNRKCYLFNIFWNEKRFDRLYIYKEEQ